MKHKAVIFDLDGTILDNEHLYCQAFMAVIRNLGVKNLEKCPHTRGIGLKSNWAKILTEFNIQTHLSLADLDLATQAAYSKLIDEVTLRAGFEAFATDLKNRGVKLALATSNYRDVTNFVIQKFQLDRFFEVVVTANDVEKTKPDPETFLLTAQKLGVTPADCLVYEDAEAGLAAARAAGMEVIHVTDDYVFNSSAKR